MSNQPADVNLLASLIAQQDRVCHERHLVQTKIERLQFEVRHLRDHELALQNQIHDVRIRGSHITLPTSALPSPKNLDFIRAWTALQEAMTKSGPDFPLSRSQCVEIIRKTVPGIADATVRSHLHRLRKRGFIEKVGGAWRLAPRHEGNSKRGHGESL